MAKKKIAVKPRKSPDWEKMAEAAINGSLDVSFYPKDGELFINLKDESYLSIILKKDGTWALG